MWEVCGRMMVEGRGAWSAISASRWNYSAYFHPDHARHGTINVHAGRFLTEDMSLFDAPFFKLTGNAVTDGASAAASVCAVVQLTGSVVKICGGYLQEMKNAREDIVALQRSITGLEAAKIKVDPGRGKGMMRRLGLPAYKWPLKHTEVYRIIHGLGKYKPSSTCLCRLTECRSLSQNHQECFAYFYSWLSWPEKSTISRNSGKILERGQALRSKLLLSERRGMP
ncbi:uncharacterized protein An13g02920 [Aspergillus niger]|uniref:Contig An13c0080, genomic contig n=2 Tax=Aspergillus niger TaxID=5061 RepID=A2R1Y8_ASPNC|nr:uncharacterized protein An13g02920 [Aspergillus niger]CAK41688.1 unnamed protein product [Aspergillus niger]